jgi:hypothetical protein
MYLDKLDSTTQAIVNAAFPSYNGRKFRMEIANHPLNVKSYWDGGSRDYFTFVNLATRETASMPAQSAFDPQIAGADAVNLPAGFVCVEHSIFCGKDGGITIHVQPDNAPLLLPAPESELSENQKIVLLYTRCRKSSYAGIYDYRFYDANRTKGISRQNWDSAKAALIASGHLNKAGAITVKGKNAVDGQWV